MLHSEPRNKDKRIADEVWKSVNILAKNKMSPGYQKKGGNEAGCASRRKQLQLFVNDFPCFPLRMLG